MVEPSAVIVCAILVYDCQHSKCHHKHLSDVLHCDVLMAVTSLGDGIFPAH